MTSSAAVSALCAEMLAHVLRLKRVPSNVFMGAAPIGPITRACSTMTI